MILAMLAQNVTRNALLASDVRVARTFWQRLRGWMLAPSAEQGAGLLIERCVGIHTCFMRFPIDALFLDRENRVVALVRAMPPWRMGRLYSRACRVLELPAGVVEATATQPGDQVAFSEEGEGTSHSLGTGNV